MGPELGGCINKVAVIQNDLYPIEGSLYHCNDRGSLTPCHGNEPSEPPSAGASVTAPPPHCTSLVQGSSGGRSLARLEEKPAAIACVCVCVCVCVETSNTPNKLCGKFKGIHLLVSYHRYTN